MSKEPLFMDKFTSFAKAVWKKLQNYFEPGPDYDSLVIWGGIIQTCELNDFLEAWQLKWMPYRIWEWVSDLAFEESTLPEQSGARTLKWLERGRLFGKGGDLSLRRDGEQFLWHFTGVANVAQLKEDEFQAYVSPERLVANDRYVQLWGVWKGGYWQEDRVASGTAHLKYPLDETDLVEDKTRLKLNYREYLRGDRVEAVWWLGIEAGSFDQEAQHAI